jgi:hypothetical protein
MARLRHHPERKKTFAGDHRNAFAVHNNRIYAGRDALVVDVASLQINIGADLDCNLRPVSEWFPSRPKNVRPA